MHVTQPGTERLQETVDRLWRACDRSAPPCSCSPTSCGGRAGLSRALGAAVLPSHARALDDIARCRTAALGATSPSAATATKSTSSSLLQEPGVSPLRPGHDRALLARQRRLLLPVPYFHVVFPSRTTAARSARTSEPSSVPSSAQPSRPWLRSPATTISSAPRSAPSPSSTWTRTLECTPTSTCSSPLGAGSGWPHLAPAPEESGDFSHLSAPSAALPRPVLALARRALPGVPLPPIPWEKRWVVFAKPVAHGAEKVLEYLGRYVHRTAMSDRALLAMDDRSVTLRYRDSRDRRHKVLTLPADEMLRRFLQHVPPKGMHRVRAFGLLHPAQRQTLRRLQLLLAPRRPGDQEPASDPPPPRARTKCAHCGQPGLTLVLRFEPDLAMSAQPPRPWGPRPALRLGRHPCPPFPESTVEAARERTSKTRRGAPRPRTPTRPITATHHH